MATPQPAVLNRNMGQHQWYVHLSRLDGADMGVIKSAVQQLRKDCADKGINLTIGLGPSLLSDLTDDGPTISSPTKRSIRSMEVVRKPRAPRKSSCSG